MNSREGFAEGIVKARRDIILEHLAALGEIPEELRVRITSETDIDVLKVMIIALFRQIPYLDLKHLFQFQIYRNCLQESLRLFSDFW